MQYNSYFPTAYPGIMPQIPQSPQPPQNNNSINWVQGENGAKSFMLGPGQSVLLMDSESDVFYIKSTDQSGMPSPLRIFDYKERTAQPKEVERRNDQYVTHEELEKRIAELKEEKDGQLTLSIPEQ